MTDVLTRDYRAVTISVSGNHNLIDEMKRIPGFSLKEVDGNEFYLKDQTDGDEIYFRPEHSGVKHVMSSNVLGSEQSSGQDHLAREPEFNSDKVVKLYNATKSLKDSPLNISLHPTEEDIKNLSKQR